MLEYDGRESDGQIVLLCPSNITHSTTQHPSSILVSSAAATRVASLTMFQTLLSCVALRIHYRARMCSRPGGENEEAPDGISLRKLWRE